MSWFSVILIILALWFGYKVGWEQAHSTVARECDRLGSFYVGDKTYVCTDIKVKEKHND